MKTMLIFFLLISLSPFSSNLAFPKKESIPQMTTRTSDRISLRFLGDFTYPTGTRFQSTEIGGLSSLYYHAETRVLSALSDDRGDYGRPRLYQFSLSFDSLRPRVNPLKVIFLKQEKDKDFPGLFLDPEGLTYLTADRFVISTEGLPPIIPPSILLFHTSGIMERVWNIPSKFISPTREDLRTQGVSPNGALESLASTPDQKWLFAGVEWPLKQDERMGNTTRLLSYYKNSEGRFALGKEYAYELTPDMGLTELVALNPQSLLALERGYDPSTGKQSALLFKISLEEASDISKYHALGEVPQLKKVKKEMLLNFESLKNRLQIPRLDNFEGMTIGPVLANGNPTLIVVSDNNFGRDQRTLFLFFEMIRN